MRVVPACLTLLLSTPSSWGADGEQTEFDWKKHGAALGLSASQVENFARDKVVVSSSELRQSFSAYLGHGLPNFITADAVLNAFHVLFEETLRRREVLNAAGLRRFVTEDWALLATIDRTYTGDATAIQAARQRARFVLGVAVKLMGGDVSTADEPLRDAIEAEAELIKNAEGQHKPALLGKPEPDFIGFDYTLFRPARFYADMPALQHYFRALRWLQLVPFRLERREELLAWHMLERSVASPTHWKEDAAGAANMTNIEAKWLPEGASQEVRNRLFDYLMLRMRFFHTLGAAFSHLDLQEAKVADENEFPIRVDEVFFRRHETALQERLARAGEDGAPVIGDRIREARASQPETDARVFSAVCLPEDAALAAIAGVGSSRAPGLEFAAWLGLPDAIERMRHVQHGEARLAQFAKHPPERYHSAAEKDADKPWWKVLPENYSDSLLQYQAALASLGEVDARAPAFMRGRPWETKTLQTVAASWAQERHAWALQAMPEVHFLKAAGQTQGFIEPVPPFFLRLSWVASQMGALAAETEGLLDPVQPFIEEAAENARWLREAATENASKQDLDSAIWYAQEFLGKLDEPFDWKQSEKATAADALRLAQKMSSCALRLRKDARPGTPLWGEVQSQRLWTDRLWHDLELVCLRLSLLADKQLSGLPFNENEAAFVEYLGMQLSRIMLYRGQAWTHPADDAPRIARLFSDSRSGAVMHVGIGRPRIMYVLYPWEGREVLCRGVVMPYHEATAKTTLTDKEWRKQFATDTRPAVPEWLKDLVPMQNIKLVEP